jgi:two-component system cell cycle response regulator DivK
MLAEPTQLDAPRTVVVVDDDVEIRETLEVMLNEEGYPVRTAINGVDALNILEVLDRPGVILLDLTMPVMDGNTLLATLDAHPRFSAIPVVILSAVAHRAAPGAKMVMSKPIDFEAVLDVVRQHCGPAVLVRRA